MFGLAFLKSKKCLCGFARHNGLVRLVLVGELADTGVDLGDEFFHCSEIHFPQHDHATRSDWHGVLHERRSLPHELHCGAEVQGPGGNVSRILTEAVAGGEVGGQTQGSIFLVTRIFFGD